MKIIINEFEFTKEQAEKVYRELKEIFGAKEDVPVLPYVPYDPYIQPRYPDWLVRPGTTSYKVETSNVFQINKDDIQ